MSAAISDIEATAKELVAAGSRLADLALLPSIKANMPQLEHKQRASVYAGLVGALMGYMAADLGPDDAETVYLGFSGAFDQVRSERIRLAAGLN